MALLERADDDAAARIGFDRRKGGIEPARQQRAVAVDELDEVDAGVLANERREAFVARPRRRKRPRRVELDDVRAQCSGDRDTVVAGPGIDVDEGMARRFGGGQARCEAQSPWPR